MSRDPRPDPEEDARLVERARDGDRQAFERLVRRHLRAARRVALARTGDEHDADDVCQEAFVRALERLEECREPSRFRGWLLAIVRSRAADLTGSVERTRGESLDGLDRDAAGVVEDGGVDAAVSEDLAAAIDALPEQQRRVVLMHDYEGWSHGEVAERLGIAEGTSRYHLHQARERLRSRLTEAGYERGRSG